MVSGGGVTMNTTVDHATRILERLNENDQNFVMDFLVRLEKKQELEKKLSDAEYLYKLQRSIDQIAEGRGIVRDIIEAEDDE